MIPSLRVSVFGITRSGKDYSISLAVRMLRDSGLAAEHFPGIPSVREYSESLLGKKFSATSMDEKGLLMEAFRKKMSDRRSVPYLIQDEHYSFPVTYGGKPLNNEYTEAKFPFVVKQGEGGKEYEVMFKDEWMLNQDAAIYLNPDADVILNRIRSSEGSKRNDQITEDDIREWKKFEISSLDVICKEHNVPFRVLNMNEGAAAVIIKEINELCKNVRP